ncbi:hypothetical protein WA158_001436 [Blastocystis sp. Blastoise]
MCTRTKYNRRLVCNSCERHKLAKKDKSVDDSMSIMTDSKTEAPMSESGSRTPAQSSITPINKQDTNHLVSTQPPRLFEPDKLDFPPPQLPVKPQSYIKDESNTYPSVLSKDGQLFNYDGSVKLDHKPMLTQKGTILSFENLNDILLDNKNVSLNSIDTLERFNDFDFTPFDQEMNYSNFSLSSNIIPPAITSKRPYQSNSSLYNNSYGALNTMAQNVAAPLYPVGQPTQKGQNDDITMRNQHSSNQPSPATRVAPVLPNPNNSHGNQDIYICNIPAAIPIVDNIERYDYIHINVKYCKSPFAVIPVNKDIDTLSYIRHYIEEKLWSEYRDLSFTFISRDGADIYLYQEPSIKVFDHVVDEEWTHHTYYKIILRHHLFINIHYNNEQDKHKRRRLLEGDDDSKNNNTNNKNEEFKNTFTHLDEESQYWCAWKFFNDYNYNSYNEKGESLLYKSVQRGDSTLCNIMIKYGADVNYVNNKGETLLHIAAKNNNKSLCMLFLSLLWRRSVVLGGYPDLRRLDKNNRECADVCTDSKIKELIRACTDRYKVVTVQNLTGKETLHDIRLKLLSNSSLQEPIKQAKFILHDTIIFKYQENDFNAVSVAINRNCFILYVPPTQYTLSQIGVNLASTQTERDALLLLSQSLSSLSLNPTDIVNPNSNNNIINSNTTNNNSYNPFNISSMNNISPSPMIPLYMQHPKSKNLDNNNNNNNNNNTSIHLPAMTQVHSVDMFGNVVQQPLPLNQEARAQMADQYINNCSIV